MRVGSSDSGKGGGGSNNDTDEDSNKLRKCTFNQFSKRVRE